MAEWKNPVPSVAPLDSNILRLIFASIEEWTGNVGGAGTPTTLLYGSGPPSAPTGVDGNWYIDSSSYSIYGPKTSGAWPSGVSMIGTVGPAGAAGPTGPQGPAGGTYNVDGGDPLSIYGGILPLDAGGI